MVIFFKSSLSPMTTCKRICTLHSKYRLSLLKYTNIPHQRVIIYIQSSCRFHFLPQCSSILPKQDVYQPTPIIHHPSSYILMLIIPGVFNTLSHSYMPSLPLPSFLLLLISCHYRFSWGLIRNPTNRLTHLYFLHTYCCSSIYLFN